MICNNPECHEEITSYRSAKRRYCNDRCKNRAAYIRRKDQWSDIDRYDKAMRNNYTILKKLKAMSLGPIDIQTLRSHGFDFDTMHKDEIVKFDNGPKTLVSRIYDIMFEINGEDQLVFIKTL